MCWSINTSTCFEDLSATTNNHQHGDWITESEVVREPQVERRVRQIAVDDNHFMRPSYQQSSSTTSDRGANARHPSCVIFAVIIDDFDPLKDISSIMTKGNMKQSKSTTITYRKAPWELTIRKEVSFTSTNDKQCVVLLQLFFTNEQLDDPQELDLIFNQIIRDCRKSNPFRIRNYERETIAQILRKCLYCRSLMVF
jgi:hypothetical protein